MHIHDFYSKLTSVTEDGHLFQALRSVSRLEDPKHVINADSELAAGEWAVWPPMEVSAACLTA